jgi:hypothetical protein
VYKELLFFMVDMKGRPKLYPRRSHNGLEGEKSYNYILSQALALDNATPWPLFPLERDPVPLVR